MPWRGVTVSEQRQRFLEEHKLNYCSVTELAERFSISRKTAHKWINRYKEHGQRGLHDRRGAGGTAQAAPSLGSTQVAQPDAAPGSQAGASGCVNSPLIFGPDNPGRSPACKAIGRLASG